MEEDFIIPDGVIIANDGTILDTRGDMTGGNPFGKVKPGQPDSIHVTPSGERIIISWNIDQMGNFDSDDDYQQQQQDSSETITSEEE